MRPFLVTLAVLIGACSSSTAPVTTAHDPTILITNTASVPLHFQWRDGQGITGSDSVAAMGSRCEQFTARADSAYFYAWATNAAGTSTYTAPWFDPSAVPNWTMQVSNTNNGSPLVLVTVVASAPC